MSNQFFTIQENYRERFFQLPKVFFTNPKYMKIKNVSKIAYAILQDRLQLSIKNKWVDEDGRIYFVYTDKKLMDILNISKNHVTTVKKELKEAGLLIQKRQGLNKPNISYLLKPEVTSDDIYKIETQENDVEASHIKDSHTEGIQIHTQRESRFTHRGNLDSHTEGTNDTDFSDTDLNNTNLNNTTTTNNIESSSSSENYKWLKIIERDLSIQMNAKFEKEILELLAYFNEEIISYAIDYTSIYARNPKPFLIKVLSKWKENDIDNINQAKSFKVNTTTNTMNFNRELTPEWLRNRENKNNTHQKQVQEYDEDFEQERQAFLEDLNKTWNKK